MTEEQKIRYSRLASIENIGSEGVDRLLKSTVLVVGCGALGSMVAMQLAGSGVGHLRIVDFDTIDLSNLQRQFFFTTSDTGQSKARTLAKSIAALNPEITVEVCEEMLTPSNARQLIEGCDFVVEATDNPSSMLLVDKVCMETATPCVLAGVSGFSGQVLTCLPAGRRYSDIFPDVDQGGFLPCSLGGVAGPSAAIAASIQAAEALKYIVGLKPLLSDSFLVFDLLNLRFDIIHT